MTTARAFSLEIEQPITIAKTHEVMLLRQAVAANPASVALRSKLAILLFVQDQFDEAIDLFTALLDEAPDADLAWYLSECHISRETPRDDALSEAAARRSLALAADGMQRAQALAALGKALTRQGRSGEAQRALQEALEHNPRDSNAFKRLASLALANDDTATLLAAADRLLAQGVGHSRLMVARALALAKLGRIDEARDAIGLESLSYKSIIDAPPGWPDIAAFNAAIKAELARHPDLRFDRYGTASSETWRIDEPVFAGSVAIPALQRQIRDRVIDHVATLDARDTPWTNGRPAEALLHNWCVLTDATGFEEWHVHQGGWLSGVYYVDVPAAVAEGDGPEGCLAFGLPEELVGEDCAATYGQTIVRPEPGLLMMFPSHSYHRTFAHGSDQRRICLAFDVKPA